MLSYSISLIVNVSQLQSFYLVKLYCARPTIKKHTRVNTTITGIDKDTLTKILHIGLFLIPYI
jgi:hypothetical protein